MVFSRGTPPKITAKVIMETAPHSTPHKIPFSAFFIGVNIAKIVYYNTAIRLYLIKGKVVV
jgi:hypothetical protein|nr:MAG TPA: hypothetical protein [Caudoviricetes sp.]